MGNQTSTGPDRPCLPLVEPERTSRIIGAFYDVYNALGHGYLESIYARALEIVLARRGMRVEREYPAPVHFEGVQIGFHRIDLLVDRRVVVEIKSTEILPRAARRQLQNYLTTLRLEVGLILHFGPKPEFEAVIRRP